MFPHDDDPHGPYATYRSSEWDTRFGAPLADDTDDDVLELREEVERLRSLLQDYLVAARGRLIADGLLPPE